MESSNEKSFLKTMKKIFKMEVVKNLFRLLIKIIILVLIYYIFLGVFFGFKKMDTSFMSPYITEGDLLIYYRIDRNFELGDVVLIENAGKQSVYRIVAKEGQTIDINEQGRLLVDGYYEEHQAFYATDPEEEAEIAFPYTVEEGKYFVMNDYRIEKGDSRTFGTISANSILGKVIGRLQIRNI